MHEYLQEKCKKCKKINARKQDPDPNGIENANQIQRIRVVRSTAYINEYEF